MKVVTTLSNELLLKIKLECLSGLKAQYKKRNQKFLNCMKQLNSLALAGYR